MFLELFSKIFMVGTGGLTGLLKGPSVVKIDCIFLKTPRKTKEKTMHMLHIKITSVTFFYYLDKVLKM